MSTQRETWGAASSRLPRFMHSDRFVSRETMSSGPGAGFSGVIGRDFGGFFDACVRFRARAALISRVIIGGGLDGSRRVP
jgi:hypothetical protein